MLSKRYIEKQLKTRFAGQEVITRDQLLSFYKETEPDLNDATFGWRIFDLKQSHVIKDVGKSLYTLEDKQKFKPEFDRQITRIAKFLETSFDHFSYSIWTTAWLNEMIELQTTSVMHILEVDKESLETVFYNLKDKGFENVYLKPDETMLNFYISEIKDAIIVKSIISRAPVFKKENVMLPHIEKILVDLFCDDKLYFAYQGSQLIKIYEYCLEKYLLNYSRLLNYAKRRKRQEGITNFLTVYFKDKIKDILDQ